MRSGRKLGGIVTVSTVVNYDVSFNSSAKVALSWFVGSDARCQISDARRGTQNF